MARLSFDDAVAPLTTGVPRDYSELWETQWELIESRVRRAGIPPQDVEDVAVNLVEKMMVKDILRIYDPSKDIEDPRKSRFAAFVTVFCDRYLLWEREKLQTRQYREAALDFEVLPGRAEPEFEDEVLSEFDATITISQMREAVVAFQAERVHPLQPCCFVPTADHQAKPKRAHPRYAKLVDYWDLLVSDAIAGESRTQLALAETLGVNTTTAAKMRRDVRLACRERALTPVLVSRT